MAITRICALVVSVSDGMSSRYHYESVKDTLKWHNLSVREHTRTIMRIGNLYHLPEKTFEEIKNENKFLEVSKEDLDKMYKDL